jgi:hypothetical protein
MEGSRPEGHITGPRYTMIEVDGQKTEKNGAVL